ncbi:uncharacterized protein [Spinacia oleracea]|uniref:Transmembrane protein n=1 Tax=Spinacia oleracea TaxID=3562 RepID=A0A9R0JHF9_SPIOL|nr:uncharacterized protein LOC110775203 [Spinacia oleracea]
MSSSLPHIQLLFKLEPLQCSVRESILRTKRKISGKQVFKLQANKRRGDSPLKRIIRRYFSPCYDQHWFRLSELAQNHVNTSKKDNEAEEKVSKKEIRNSLSQDRNAEDSNGNGNRGNGNDKGNGGDNGGDDQGHRSNPAGIEWWLWWKWRQACYKAQNGSTRSNMWPVDAAVQAVADEVMENIEPVVKAVVLEPIKQHITKDGFVLVLVFGVLLVSIIQMVVGLAILSMGVSLAGVAAFTLALLWLSRKTRGNRSQRDNEKNDNG